jgi:hypothetical protein
MLEARVWEMGSLEGILYCITAAQSLVMRMEMDHVCKRTCDLSCGLLVESLKAEK